MVQTSRRSTRLAAAAAHDSYKYKPKRKSSKHHGKLIASSLVVSSYFNGQGISTSSCAFTPPHQSARQSSTFLKNRVHSNSEFINSNKPKVSKYFARKNASTDSDLKSDKIKSEKEVKSELYDENDESVQRTQSFAPLSHLTFNPNSSLEIHTLILGTHPSITSLAESQYFGHPMNAFWWIAGDNLGFRRASGVSPSSGKPYQLAKDLLYSEEHIIPYEEQIRLFTSHGFALWDICRSCERKGSLDMDIKKEEPNQIREFCKEHPSIKRIVLANGTTGATFFNRHFKDWWQSGDLRPGMNKESIKVFQRFAKVANDFENSRIECICGLGVSPAAAKFSYIQKRDFYMEHCYGPGLADHERLNTN